jgi:hypothetical protein
MQFRTGKYAGMTVDQVRRIAPWYIQWVKENRPEMLRERTSKKAKAVVKTKIKVKSSAMKPNLNFLTKNEKE